MKIPQIHTLSKASQFSLLAVVILLGAVFFTVNGALQQQQNTASHASGNGIISGHVYRLSNRCSLSQAVDVSNNSMDNSAHIIQWPWTIGGWNKDREWIIKDLGNGYYSIESLSSTRYLDVSGDSKLEGAQIVQYRGTNSPFYDEQWTITNLGNGYYKIVGRNSKLALGLYACSASQGLNVRQYAFNNESRNEWKFDDITSSPPPPVPTATPTPTPPTVPGGNLLKNPSFESGTAYWSLTNTSPGIGMLSSSSTAEDGHYSAQVLVFSGSANQWYVQLKQSGLPMQSGRTYTVSFWAKASTSRQFENVVQQTVSPYAVYADHEFSVTTSWQQYSYTFTANTSQSNVFVGFNLAKSTGVVLIDNVNFSVNGSIIQPTPTTAPPPSCAPRPPCLDTIPRCLIAEPAWGWCPVIPTPTSTPGPSNTPSNTPSNVPSNAPSNQPSSPPPPAGSTLVKVTLGLHGIGNGGDSANPNSQGNMSPHRSSRTITMEVYDASNQLILSQQGTVTYDSNSGKFSGTVNLGQNFTTGLYTVKVKTDQFLRSIVPGIQTINAGQTTTLPGVTLVAGDVNGDNAINIVDYNLLIGCYSDLLPATDCNATNNVLTDLNDDGAVNQFDYNLFLRELSNVGGQ
ncbi:MAG TPA: RICIN domain-containing protein [Candidatus Acidoferrales bacterium]|nr:RICIN domain-containing protein [Candidatus Acidoferrales bacterium]